ncbi:DC-STAMP domain-containing protein 2 isoform X1 [Drosophila eugracilis]|uniref:DC-STAMP domain-containing protein 2 isoform X1 n=1 Tax=Drosophila eugracilis TaxID=29029 RepID=UPI0007E72D99|nr:DC-STAMP domain-containing protein 2 isoform X1 [Drosophila eugracilis]
MEEDKPNDSALWTYKLVTPYIVFGYLTGLAATLVWNWWQLGQLGLGISLTFAFPLAVVLVLLYSRPARCILALSVPSLCSSRGRAFLISLAFVMAAVGPTANIVANLKVMLRSLSCGQELLRQALGQMLDVILEPVNAIQLAVDLLLLEVRRVLKQAMVVLLRIQEHMIAIIETLKNCSAWLKSVVDLCNTEMGTPWTRCKKTAQHAMIRCQAKMGIFSALCHATKLFLALCYPARIIDVFCKGYGDFSWSLLDKVLDRYREFVRQIEQMFDANITFQHEFSFDTNSSKSLSDVGEEIIQDINDRLPSFAFLNSFVDILCWVMVLTVFFKAIIFYLRYMYSRQFQNVFLTDILLVIDRRHEKHGFGLLLPLQRLERGRYMKLTSLQLTLFEFVSVVENACFMVTTSLQLFAICFLDYGLFWLLATMSFHGHQEAGLEVPAYIDLEIKGGGFVADVMRGIANAFRPLTQKSTLDTNPCLPLPIKPDYAEYIFIFLLCLLAWLILLSEPYVLRTRHLIMFHFYPARAKERGIYLYNKIADDRTTIFKVARRRKRNEYNHKRRVQEKHFRCFTWLNNRLSRAIRWCSCFSICQTKERCTICGTILTPSTRHPCDTPGCKGVYCFECFEMSYEKCCLCNRPLEYGDFSDVSEVDDSSEDSDMESFGKKRYRKFCGGQS